MSRIVITSGRRYGKALQLLYDYATENGWQAQRTNGGHLRWLKPGRPIIHTSSTPSDRRAWLNALAMLRWADRQPVEVAHV
ncbi:type II toxin-antitoxin system HicA family toxin [Pseudomonas kuykendallii]|uniref:Type II toxin-antitoxin system HicA family toxin n=1 Tax=Pseudomonas kuykendallii TaxID=1007099 RepID=A0A1H3DMS2_9PSED|nr:hypothetical protein [Pseudomonas kuykendallii]MCQ4270222.1 type II toxin-antitoxin system HicA family toxin [Pseudomonas kuykendallii]SDX67715.1 hypothetical protein SAMN05216287_3488 [Pseudomonas kuykendallii]